MPEIQWLGKWLVLSGDGAGVFSKGQGGVALLGLWIRAAVRPLTRKHARRILGRFIWSLRPAVGYAPFLSGWWAHYLWGANWLQNCPGSLLKSLLHCLLLSFRAWTPQLLLPLGACRGGGGGSVCGCRLQRQSFQSRRLGAAFGWEGVPVLPGCSYPARSRA